MKKGVKPPIILPYSKSLNIQKLRNSIAQKENNIHLKGLYGSAISFVIEKLFKENIHNILWILESKENASYHYNDIESLISSNEFYFLPSSYSRENNFKNTNSQNIFRRTEFIRNYNLSKNLTITYPEALFEKIILRKELKNRKIILQTNNQISLEILNEKLFELDFERVDFVVEPGDFSVRGGIVDVFSYSNDLPYRIEFFSDEIESIRNFDIETQISNKNFKKIEILGDIENKDIDYERESIFDFISDDTIVISENIDLLEESLSSSYKKLKQTNENDVENIFCSGDSIHLDIKKFKVIELNKIDNQTPDVKFNIAQQPAFNKKFNLLIENITTLNDQGYSIRIFCSNETQINRFQEIFELNKLNFDPILISKSIYKGFIDHDNKEVCYSDHEIFERYHKFKIKQGFKTKLRVNLNELKQLQIGDYVTHIDHGIGIFGGLKKIEVNGKRQEAIKLSYGERDTLYVSIHLIHKICKYNGKDGTKPKI